MRHEILSETFDKSYYREAIRSFDPISIETIPNWLDRIEDAKMKYKALFYTGDPFTSSEVEAWNPEISEAWAQFRKTRKDFLNWFNGLLETHGYDRFLDEDNYWELHRIV